MIVGVPTEIKSDEYRVAMTPVGVRELTAHGHRVVIQQGAGDGSSIPDEDFVAVGAEILPSAEAVFDAADLIVKVKAGDLTEMRSLLLRIREIPNVVTSELITVFKVWKERNP